MSLNLFHDVTFRATTIGIVNNSITSIQLWTNNLKKSKPMEFIPRTLTSNRCMVILSVIPTFIIKYFYICSTQFVKLIIDFSRLFGNKLNYMIRKHVFLLHTHQQNSSEMNISISKSKRYFLYKEERGKYSVEYISVCNDGFLIKFPWTKYVKFVMKWKNTKPSIALPFKVILSISMD